MKVLILAGGFATRLWPLTIDKAKPLLPIAGKPMISHLVDALPKELSIIVSTNAVFAKDFFDWKRAYPSRNIEIFVEDANAEKGKMGAAKAVVLVIESFNIQEDLLILGGDNIFLFKLTDFLASLKGKPALAAFDIQDVEKAKKFGVVIADGKRIVDFEEKPEQPKSTLVGTLCYYFPASVLGEVKKTALARPDNLGGIFEHLLKIGTEPEVFEFREYWNDIGSFHAYIDAHKFLGGVSVPESLLDPALANQFEGVNYIEEGVHILNSVVRDAIIMRGTILRNCTVSESIIDKDCEFSDLDMHREIIRQGTVLLSGM